MNIRRTLTFLTMFIMVAGLLRSQPGNFRFSPVISPKLPVSINDIDQDSLGFMWISSGAGIDRWDGTDVVQIRSFKDDSNSINLTEVVETHISSGGIFWIATYNGVIRYNSENQSFQQYLGKGPNPALPGPIPYCIAEDQEGFIWIGTRRNGLAKLDPRTEKSVFFQHDPEQAGSLSGNRIEDIFVDRKGRVWIAAKDGGLCLFLPKSNSFKNYSALPGNEQGLLSDKFRDLAETKDGHILIATAGGGVSKLNPETDVFTHNLHQPDNPGSLSSSQGFSLLNDSKGNLWVGSYAYGLNFRKKGSPSFRRFFMHEADPTSLQGNVVNKIFEDRQGLIWVGTSYGGLSIVDPSMQNRFVHFRHQPGNPNSLNSNKMAGIAQVNDNELWMGTVTDGLSIYYRDEDRFEQHRPIPGDPNSLPNNGVWVILKDSQERIWVSTSRGVSLWNPLKHNFTNYGTTLGEAPLISNRNVISMAEGPEGKLWLGTWGGGLNIFDPETGLFEQMKGPLPEMLEEHKIKAMLRGLDGSMWLGGTLGLNRYDPQTKTFSSFSRVATDSTQLALSNVNALAESAKGNIWIGGVDGLAMYDVQSKTFKSFNKLPGAGNLFISGLALDAQGRVWYTNANSMKVLDPKSGKIKTYDYFDGTQGNDYSSFSYASSGQPILQFGGSQGMTEVNTTYEDSLSHPPVVFTDFRLFNKVLKVDENGILKSSIERTNKVILDYQDDLFSFGFAALDYRKPQQYQYAYRLAGLYKDWIYTDQSNRRATFTNVPHGSYRLEIKASLDGEHWSKPTSLGVQILPPWWKTWWAQTAFVLAFLILLISIYRIRLSSLRRQKRVLEVQVKERTAEVVAQKEVISVEKARSDALLLNILPESIAEELKAKQKAETRHFESVSVLFTDFVGFTQIAEQLSPGELVQELDLFFRGFDGIVDQLGLEKIKTIGDAYMCAGGLPEPHPNHAQLLVQAGLEMLEHVQQTNLLRTSENRPTWNIRIGIHSGPVVAGVVGNKKFAYDIWGDAVNTASRMESSGEVNQVNVSQSTYELVKTSFKCSFRGKVYAKNKGEIEMYRVESRLKN